MSIGDLTNKVQAYSGLTKQESSDALKCGVESIAERLTEDERQDFASQLPTELQEVALGVGTVDKSDKSKLLEQFADKQKLDESVAKDRLLAVWRALKETISPGEIKDIRTQLPDDVSAMLV